ncbi:MAG: hypothetical protein CMH55_07125 [Myxococcales bacterium]|nr:hypothetical protein [Myxococcales bacterium]
MKTAVLLNGNAKRVTPGLIQNFQELVPHQDLRVSRTMQEGQAIIEDLVDNGYQRIMSGGGDGTFVQVVNDLVEVVGRRHAEGRPAEMPRVGILRLGTGNAVASFLGSSRPTRDLIRLRDGRVGAPIPLSLIESEGRRFPFAGFGYDGELLNDYIWFKRRVTHPVLRPMLHSVGGYFAALGLRTIPRHVTGQGIRTPMRITSLDTSWYSDPSRADHLTEQPPGTVLFEGIATSACVGAVPYYGYAIKMFPFAGMHRGTFHLRVASMGVGTILGNLGTIWRGTYRNPTQLFDFLCKRIRIECQEPLPFQIGGDGAGYRNDLEFRSDPVTVPLVNMRLGIEA